jgi:hypothetical protein
MTMKTSPRLATWPNVGLKHDLLTDQELVD